MNTVWPSTFAVLTSLMLLFLSIKNALAAPRVPDRAYLTLSFNSANSINDMVLSEARKNGAPYYTGRWSVEVPNGCPVENDYALVLKDAAKHYAISAKFRRPFRFEQKKQFVVQYEVKFQEPLGCGGAYVKLLSHDPNMNLKEFDDKTPFTIMFGPDKCGKDHKIHFIFRTKNHLTGEFEERMTKVTAKNEMERYFKDGKTHLFTLVVNSDNSFAIYMDQVLVNSGSMLTNIYPIIHPQTEIDDPKAVKPADWDDRLRIADPASVKPADWDENQPLFIPDANAKMPATWLPNEPPTIPNPTSIRPKNWDDKKQGVWKADIIDNPACKTVAGCGPWTGRPQVKNPLYRGKWIPATKPNPAYQGIWKPKKIPNPYFYAESNPFKMAPIAAIGMELWTMTKEIAFDNFLVIDNKDDADLFASQTWALKKDEEVRADPSSQSVVDAIRYATNDRPWLWLVIVASIVGPIGLFFYWLFKPSTGYEGYGKRRSFMTRDFEEEKKEEVEPAGSVQNKTNGVRGKEESTNYTNESEEPTTRRRTTRKD